MVKDTIQIDDLVKIDLRVGLVEKAENLENSDKLIRLTVDFGPPSPEAPEGERIRRNVLTGLRQWYAPEDFEGTHFVFVLNLAPRAMAGEESQGMLLCAEGEDKPLPIRAPEGSKAGQGLR